MLPEAVRRSQNTDALCACAFHMTMLTRQTATSVMMTRISKPFTCYWEGHCRDIKQSVKSLCCRQFCASAAIPVVAVVLDALDNAVQLVVHPLNALGEPIDDVLKVGTAHVVVSSP